MNHTDETKQKLSEMRKGKNNPFFGKKHSPKTIELIGCRTRQRNLSREYDLSPVTIRIPSSVALYYFCGLVDGEGSIKVVGKTKKNQRVSVYNTNLDVMNWIVNNIGGTYRLTDNRGRVPCYEWTVQSANNVFALCKAMDGICIIKKDDISSMISFLMDRYGDRIGKRD